MQYMLHLFTTEMRVPPPAIWDMPDVILIFPKHVDGGAKSLSSVGSSVIPLPDHVHQMWLPCLMQRVKGNEHMDRILEFLLHVDSFVVNFHATPNVIQLGERNLQVNISLLPNQ